MSFLADIHSYWASNSTLNGALPATQVYTGLAPESIDFPYAVIVPLALTPTFVTGSGYFGTFSFQISIFDTDPDNVEDLANTVAGQFDYQQISALTMSCERTDGPTFMVDPDTQQRTYHAVITYDLLQNRTMPGA